MIVTHFLPRSPRPDPSLPPKQYAAEHCKQTRPAGVYDLSLAELESACRAAACVGLKGDAGYIVACAVDGSRSNANSAPASFLLIDQDGDGEEPDWKHLDQYQGFAWTTASHCPEVPSWRVVIPLTEPLAHGQMRSPFRGSYVRARSQPAFLPTHPVDVAQIQWRRLAGNLTIDARELGGTERQFEERDDSLLAAAFAAAGLVEGPQAGGVRVRCPWTHLHSDGQPGGTVVLHADPDGRGFGKFHCSRTECLKAKHSSWDALAAIRSIPAVAEELRHWPDPGLNGYQRVAAPAAEAPGAVQQTRHDPLAPLVSVDSAAPVEPAPGQRATPETWGALMNAKHTVLTCVGGKCRVLTWKANDLGWRAPVLSSLPDFRSRYAPRTIWVEGVKKPVCIADWWLEWPGRAEAETLVFRPDVNAPRVGPDLNLWQGYGIAPVEGAWPLMQAFIRDIVAGGDEKLWSYIIRWIAWVLQFPGERAGVVLVLRGRRGTGKNTLLDALCRIFGQHAKTVSNPRHLVGNFNAHLQDCALLFANEAIAASDKTAESVLKTLVTDDTLPIERKGIDVEMAPNRLTICMASNEDWCVPAGLDERRFAVIDVSDARIQDLSYFAALRAELDGGGLAAMLHDMLGLPLEGWHPRQGVPKTRALVENQLDGLRGAERAVHQMLATGVVQGAVHGLQGLAPGHAALETKLFEPDRRLWVAATNALKVCGAVSRRVRLGFEQRKTMVWVLPPLPTAREAWAAARRLDAPWDAEVTAWDCADAPE